MTLPLAAIAPSAANPRKKFDEAALGELAESLKTVGLLEPLVVRKRYADSDISPVCPAEIIAGERRYRAAQLAGLDQAPVRVLELDDGQAAEAMLAENLQRVDLTPVEEARAFQAWTAAQPAPAKGARVNRPKELGARLGKSEDYVRERLKLLELDAAALEQVEAGAVHLAEALLLVQYPEDERAQVLEELVNGYTHAHSLREDLAFRRQREERAKAAAAKPPVTAAAAVGAGHRAEEDRWEAEEKARREKAEARSTEHWTASAAYLDWLHRATGERTKELTLAMTRNFALCQRAVRLLNLPKDKDARRQMQNVAMHAKGEEITEVVLALLAAYVCGEVPGPWEIGPGEAVAACRRLKIAFAKVAPATKAKAKKGGKGEGKKSRK